MKKPEGLKSYYIILTEWPECMQDIACVCVCVCVCAQESSLPCFVTERAKQGKEWTAQLEYKQLTEAEQCEHSQ